MQGTTRNFERRSNPMSDNNFVVGEKSEDVREIGRVNNELNPNSDQGKVPVQREVGRVNNEPNPGADHVGAPVEQEVGIVNNELNPGSDQGALPTRQEVGMANNEQASKL
jgi:hypothetical protein